MLPFLILIASAATRLIRFGFPYSVVFDEVYYGDFASKYWLGTFFFDQHPPFAKLIFAGIGYLFDMGRFSVDWSAIGNALPPEISLLRTVTLVFGIALPLVIYLLCRRFNLSKTSSAVAGLLISLENSLVVQSRYILPDAIMLVCGFSAILLYMKYRERRYSGRSYIWFLLISSVLATLAFSVKWTGLTFLFMILFLEIMEVRKQNGSLFKRNPVRRILPFIGLHAGIAIAIYVSLFAIHFALLPNSGPGNAFMSTQFQATLGGSGFENDENIAKKGFFAKFTELNTVMYTSNRDMAATHTYASKWYTWPLMTRPIFYWESAKDADGGLERSYIYLLGNPFIYWISTLSILALIEYCLFKKDARKETAIFIVIGFLANFLPFILIGRVMFLYHYETALIFSIMALALWLDFMDDRKKRIGAAVIVGISLIAFIYWSPLTYGTPLTDGQLQQRIWLPSWR